MVRSRQPVLTRQRIIDAATKLIDSEGLEALSTRRLAAVLGVAGPSLYNHFRTKDEILDAVADAVVAQVDISMFGRYDWQQALGMWARSYRAALIQHPNIVPYLVTSGIGRHPASLRMANAVFGALVDAGWSRAWATRIGAIMRYIVTGSSLGSFARGFAEDARVYTERYPHLAEAHLLARYHREVDESAFECGLKVLLDGLALVHVGLSSPGWGRVGDAAGEDGTGARDADEAVDGIADGIGGIDGIEGGIGDMDDVDQADHTHFDHVMGWDDGETAHPIELADFRDYMDQQGSEQRL